jgi:HEAT repeat protein
MTSNSACPDRARLTALLGGDDNDSKLQPLRDHLEQCRRCQEALERLAADAGSWQDARAALSDRELEPTQRLSDALLTLKQRGGPPRIRLRSAQALAATCLVARAPQRWLAEAEAAGVPTELCIHGSPWWCPHELLFRASWRKRALPILFAPTTGALRVAYWAVIAAIELDKGGSRLFLQNVESLDPPLSGADLLDHVTCQPVELAPAKTYAICLTPAPLADARAGGAPMPRPSWPKVPHGSWLARLRATPAGDGLDLSGQELIDHLLLRHRQHKRKSTKGDEDLALDLAVHAVRHPEPASAIPALLKLLKGPDVFYQCLATECLRHFGPVEATGVDLLLEKLKDDPGDLRPQLVGCLLQIGPTAHASVPLLLDALRAPEEAVRLWSLRCLRKIGPAAASAVPTLLRALKASNATLRVRIISTLAAIRAEGAQVVPALQRSLDHEDAKVRAHAARALGRYRATAATALPALLRLRKHDPDAQVRAHAQAALSKIQAAGGKAPVGPPRISFPCPGCGAPFRLSAKRAGTSVPCPGCGATVPVPRP